MAIKFMIDESEIAKDLKYRVDGADIEIVVDDETNKTNEKKEDKKMSKYQPLWEYLKNHKQDTYELTFKEIKEILNFPIDHSFLTYKKEVLEYGYEVIKISMKEEKVFIKRVNHE